MDAAFGGGRRRAHRRVFKLRREQFPGTPAVPYVACALVGEIDALRQHIEENYLAKLRADLESNISETQAKPGISLEDADDALISWHRLDGAPAGRSHEPVPKGEMRRVVE